MVKVHYARMEGSATVLTRNRLQKSEDFSRFTTVVPIVLFDIGDVFLFVGLVPTSVVFALTGGANGTRLVPS